MAGADYQRGGEKMKPKMKDRRKVRSVRFQIAISPELDEKIEERAEAIGVPKSTFANMVLTDFMKKSRQ